MQTVDMNPIAPDPASFGRGLDSPSSYFKSVYDHDPFGIDPQAGSNGGGGFNGPSGSVTNGASQCYGKELGQENADGTFNFNSPSAVMPPSPFNQPAYQQQHSAFGAGPAGGGGGYGTGAASNAVPPSPSSGSGPMFSPNPVPDSTTNFQQHQPSFGKQTNGFCSTGNGDRRSSVDTVLFEHDIKPTLAPSYFEPIRSNSVDYSAYSRFIDPKQEQAFGPPEAGASSGNGVSQSQKAFVPCKVCGDKASGYHYGVTSCEGCKGFFRRSIQKQIEYRCLRDGKCMVYRLNRNRCQYCRFKKCLAVGMSRDSVRYGRVPKRSRERMQDDARVSSMTGDSEVDSELEKKQLALYDVILSVSQAHHSNCAYTDDKIKNLAHKPIHFPLDGLLQNDTDPLLMMGPRSTDLLEQQKVVMWQTLAQYTMPEIQHVVEFAKRIPNFTELMQDDQLVLIKAGFFEVWLVRISRMFSRQHHTVMFFDGCFVTWEQMEMIYNLDLVQSMFKFSDSFNNLHLNDGEVGLFTAVVLLTPDRPGLSDSRLVEQQQEKLIEALKLQLSRSHSSDPQVFPNLLAKLTELRSVGAKHNDVLSWYRMNWRLLKLPPLYAEIYDIPKEEEQQPQPIAPAEGTNSNMSNGSSHNGAHMSNQYVLSGSPYGEDVKVPMQHIQSSQLTPTNGNGNGNGN